VFYSNGSIFLLTVPVNKKVYYGIMDILDLRISRPIYDISYPLREINPP